MENRNRKALTLDDERELLRGNTPTMILAILQDGSQHAYAIGRSISERAGDGVKFKRGTLYPVLHSLERDGLVVGKWEHEAGERPRCIYTITDVGRAELVRRAKAWNRFSEAMNNLIGDSLREQSA
jgi:PadR family transcriptional regulator PadR